MAKLSNQRNAMLVNEFNEHERKEEERSKKLLDEQKEILDRQRTEDLKGQK